MRNTNVGWKLLVKWADDSESWIPLKDTKEAHPVKLDEFSKAHEISDESAFAWWVMSTLRNKYVIISKVKARVRKMTNNYGIEMPKKINDANRLDRENKDTLWRDTLAKEITEIGITFEVLL